MLQKAKAIRLCKDENTVYLGGTIKVLTTRPALCIPEHLAMKPVMPNAFGLPGQPMLTILFFDELICLSDTQEEAF